MNVLPGEIKTNEPTHFLSLDGLRGIAILLVIPHNADVFSNSARWLWPFAITAHAGWIGVQLFFVLSGFLITRNLLLTSTSPNYFQAFYGRRILRIFPLYFLTLFVVLIVAPRLVNISASTLASYTHQVWLWTFLSNWAQPFGLEVGGFSHFWSLAIEEQFYLIWPFAVLRFAAAELLWLCGGIAFLSFLIRVVLLQKNVAPEVLYMFTICRMDALAIGGAAAVISRLTICTDYIYRHRSVAVTTSVLLLVCTALLTHTFAVYNSYTLTLGHSTIALAFAAIILTLVSDKTHTPSYWLNNMLSGARLRSVGRYSFAMYVFHMLILVALGDAIHKALTFSGAALPLLYVVVVMALSYAAGFASYHLIEKHFLKLKYLFTPLTSLSSVKPLPNQ